MTLPRESCPVHAGWKREIRSRELDKGFQKDMACYSVWLDFPIALIVVRKAPIAPTTLSKFVVSSRSLRRYLPISSCKYRSLIFRAQWGDHPLPLPLAVHNELPTHSFGLTEGCYVRRTFPHASIKGIVHCCSIASHTEKDKTSLLRALSMS